eukprot:Rmarinus@m.13024
MGVMRSGAGRLGYFRWTNLNRYYSVSGTLPHVQSIVSRFPPTRHVTTGNKREEKWDEYLGRTTLGPYVPISDLIGEDMLQLANASKEDVVYDLGCGDGRLLALAINKFGVAKACGVEIDPETFQLAKKTLSRRVSRVIVQHDEEDGLETFAPMATELFPRPPGAKAVWQHGNICLFQSDALSVDLSQATLLTLYLSREGLELLKPRLEDSLQRGARVVTCEFPISGWEAEETKQVMDVELYLYRR